LNGFRTGGELDPEDRLLQRVQELKERGKQFSTDVDVKEFYAPNPASVEEVDETSSSESDESTTHFTPTRPSRPRVVRQRRTVYSVGRGMPKVNIDSDSDQEIDEELLASIIPHFRDTSMTRYGDRCYNYGTERIALLDFFMMHRELISSPEFTQNPDSMLLSPGSEPQEAKAEFRLPDAEGPSNRQFMETSGELSELDPHRLHGSRVTSSKEAQTLPLLKSPISSRSKLNSRTKKNVGASTLNSGRLSPRGNRDIASKRVVKDAFGGLLSKDLKKWIQKLLETKLEHRIVPNRRGVRQAASVPSTK
jgi:hypothetical protein